ncbi:hypothetical protein QCA50_019257 [Cerrena zonata]|uniref:Mitochondrial zinc maintenance protein 1, mitochondrial n=1 Tax=Cerrena zonata TaxID=2478898 RepID=A0AAW0FF65_9APHY
MGAVLLPQEVFTVTAAQLAHRSRIAQTIAPLKRVRPRVPFWYLAAHRIPTLWTLYRGLLRSSPDDDVRWRIRRIFDQEKELTSPTATKRELIKGHRWLKKFEKAQAGDEYWQSVLQRYGRLIVAKREKANFIAAYRKEMSWQERLSNRPIMTGAYFRPTLYNPPLPRLKPQPLHITGMIVWRRKARFRRWSMREQLWSWKEDLEKERIFEDTLHQQLTNRGEDGFDRVYSHPEWTEHVQARIKTINRTFEADDKRSRLPYPSEMLEQIKAARRERNANKMREYLRERRGEVLKKTLRRARKGPPAHVLNVMTEEEKHLDRVSRSTSEVGYVAQAKIKLGWKLKDPEKWRLEGGKQENLDWIIGIERRVEAANLRRRRKAELYDADVKNNLAS